MRAFYDCQRFSLHIFHFYLFCQCPSYRFLTVMTLLTSQSQLLGERLVFSSTFMSICPPGHLSSFILSRCPHHKSRFVVIVSIIVPWTPMIALIVTLLMWSSLCYSISKSPFLIQLTGTFVPGSAPQCRMC